MKTKIKSLHKDSKELLEGNSNKLTHVPALRHSHSVSQWPLADLSVTLTLSPVAIDYGNYSAHPQGQGCCSFVHRCSTD